MTHRSLEDLLQNTPSTVDMLRNAQVGPNVYPGVPAEYTNWRDEQWAWQNTCVLFNQSYHMADLAVTGPDAIALLSHLGVNTFENFAVDKAKQFVPCTPTGYVIGDVILFHLADDDFNMVGRAPVLNWVTYHAQTGDYDVEVTLDQRWALRTDGRRESFRFQLQGPSAMDVIARALNRTPPELKFFNLTSVQIAGRDVRALRHGMVGQPGLGALRRLGGLRGGALGARRGWARVRAAARRAAERIRRTRSSQAGSPLRCPPSTPARSSGRTESGCPPPATRAPPRSGAASSPRTSRTTTSRPGISATAIWSSSITTSSAGARSSGLPTTNIVTR